MTATAIRQDFSDYCAQRDAQNTIQLNVVKWTWMLCDALRDAAPDGYDYIFESGNKYHKVIMLDTSGHRSVHCLSTRRLVKSTSLHLSKHLLKVFVMICVSSKIVSICLLMLIGRAVICIAADA